MKKTCLFLGVFATILLMISAATAVPVNNSKKIVENIDYIKNTNDSYRKLLEKAASGLLDGIIDLIIQLINLTIQIILKVVEIVQNLFALISSIKNLINAITAIFELIQHLIDLLTGNPNVEAFF